MDDMSQDADSMALDKIIGDMDGMEGRRVYGDKPEDAPADGVSITIDVAPKMAEKKEEEKPMDEPALPPVDDSKMPPFLRKRS